MNLPQSVRGCMDRLEAAGYECYAVGGCVRDWKLGLTPHDYDLCTAASPMEIREVFSGHRLVLAGEKHGTVGIITGEGVVEITAFRTESGYRDNRHPDTVTFVRSVREDLARRDYTVNAMAWSPIRGLVDPFGGEDDLKNKVLRAVGDAQQRFREDSLRILRGARFAVRFGLRVEEKTMAAMESQAHLMDNLARERVFEELCKLLPLVKAEDLLRFAPVITRAIPELEPCVGFDQRNPHHIYDVYTHIAHVTENVPALPVLRWAALLHDVGKPATFTLDEKGNGHFYGHAAVSAEMADEILRRLKAPNHLREQVVMLVQQHMSFPDPDKKLLRRRLSRLGADDFDLLLTLQEADTGSKGTDARGELAYFPHIRRLLEEILAEDRCLHIRDLQVNGHDLMALGYSGPAIGRTLNALLEEVLQERLPNERDALLNSLTNKNQT